MQFQVSAQDTPRSAAGRKGPVCCRKTLKWNGIRGPTFLLAAIDAARTQVHTVHQGSKHTCARDLPVTCGLTRHCRHFRHWRLPTAMWTLQTGHKS